MLFGAEICLKYYSVRLKSRKLREIVILPAIYPQIVLIQSLSLYL
jgi:hypothetical protein